MKLGLMSDSVGQFRQHRYGDCGVEVYEFVKRAIATGRKDFIVVDGMVKVGELIIPHTWVETARGVVDPTANQFADYESQIVYSPSGEYRVEYSPMEYVQYYYKNYN